MMLLYNAVRFFTLMNSDSIEQIRHFAVHFLLDVSTFDYG